MSQHQYIATLEKQIASLNRNIDAKILRGQQYAEESRKHRMLLRKIREQKNEHRSGFFGKLFPAFA
jgi:hypothetical protein